MIGLPISGPGTAGVRTAAVIGGEGHLVEARAEISSGQAAFGILGLSDTAVREIRDRVRAAVLNGGLPWPAAAITVSLLPDSLPKHGTGFDLAIAVAVLAAAGVVPADVLAGCVFVAGLGLDGGLRPVPGVLPALLAAASAGSVRAVVASRNGAEAAVIPGLAAVPCGSLRAVLAGLRREPFPAQAEDLAGVASLPVPADASVTSLGGVAVTPLVRLALETSAAGGHHLGLDGPHGSGIPALAAGMAALLPPLSAENVMEVSAIHSVAGCSGRGMR